MQNAVLLYGANGYTGVLIAKYAAQLKERLNGIRVVIHAAGPFADTDLR